MIIAHNCYTKLTWLKQQLNLHFPTTHDGILKWVIGIKVEHTVNGRLLTMKQYIIDMLSKFGMSDSNHARTPMDPSTPRLLEGLFANDKTTLNEKLPIRSLIGSLMYISNAIRPDITQSVNMCARFMSRPTEVLWTACKRILRYLKGTMHYGILYKKTGELHAYTDSDWAGDSLHRKSTTGYLVMLAQAPIIWGSSKQATVTTSSTEAELIAAYNGVKRVIFTRKLLTEIKYFKPNHPPTNVYQDNRAAILIQQNLGSVRRVRHMEIKYFYTVDLINSKQIQVHPVGTKEEIADIFTKPLSYTPFFYLAQKIMAM